MKHKIFHVSFDLNSVEAYIFYCEEIQVAHKKYLHNYSNWVRYIIHKGINSKDSGLCGVRSKDNHLCPQCDKYIFTDEEYKLISSIQRLGGHSKIAKVLRGLGFEIHPRQLLLKL